MRNRIIWFHTDHPNDVESVTLVRDAFAAVGYALEGFCTGDADFAARLGRLLTEGADEIFCFISSNYAVTEFRVAGKMIDAATGIPLVICLFDHPIFSLQKHTAELDDAILWVQGEDAADFARGRLSTNTNPVTQLGPFPQHYEHPAPDYADFIARRNEIICPMNLHVWGIGLDGAWQKIRELPGARRSFAMKLVDEMMYDTSTPFHSRAAELARALPIEETAMADGQLAMTFLKLWRRDRMLRALIDLPIIVSSEWVPADLDFRFPDKFTLFSMKDTVPLYGQFRFVLNTYPLITHTFHDRVLRALFANSVCVSDANVVMSQYFRDDKDMIFFDYQRPERTRERLLHYLDDAAAAFALTISAYETSRMNRAMFFDTYERLIDTIEEKWTSSPRPAG